ncbi:hypothetical protein A3H75_03215 [Candidatus Uhrbacteria bacterium RIFCSPLOWO2_02_FULL_51_9]|uniref:Uncharacterized protein n=1 Tax=Candidatus Uhrbacteria bacterium RIFCSPLOWO2_02_FULL_51_9 TaxID=1802410 RepID=A0A1F7VFI7_9BACT|nr:MAG: hypothetical protein A3H75_03215 [Candidatus Uhrbacteria bacterium RIFCSPLOWO2_02_FULL_51_9]
MLFIFLLGDLLIVLVHIFWRDEIGFFDIDKEGNLASLYTGAKLWIVATLALLNGAIIMRLRTPRRINAAWLLFALGLAYIGLDDMMGIHERIGFVLNNMLGTGGFHGESFNWLFYFAPAMLAALVVFGIIIKTLWRSNRRAAWLLLGGVVVWIGSLGIEFWGRALITRPTIPVSFYHKLIVVEEGLELLGATLIALALVRTIQKTILEHIEIKKV